MDTNTLTWDAHKMSNANHSNEYVLTNVNIYIKHVYKYILYIYMYVCMYIYIYIVYGMWDVVAP